MQKQENKRYSVIPCEEGDVDRIKMQLRKYDDAFASPVVGIEDERLIYIVTDPSGMLVAGCTVGIDCWGVAAVDDLWVDKRHRKKGLGSALMRTAEQAAADRGCYLMLIGTFDFQALDFCEKLGYDLFNIWEDFPAGHADYSLAKRLTKGRAETAGSDTIAPYEIALGEEEYADYIAEKVAEFNHCRVPYLHGYQDIDNKICDKDGDMIAGYAAGNNGWDVAMLNMIWVDAAYRGQGLGTALLADFERKAKEKGAYLALLGAYEWQVDFFKKHGYTITGELRDCPNGHIYYSLEKRI